MAHFRIETDVDPSTGKIFSELYYPAGESAPIVRTKAVYDTHEQAQEHALEMIKQVFSEQPVRIVPGFSSN